MFPTLYESGLVSIQTLWISVVLALLISSYLTVQRLKRAHVDFTIIINHSTSIILTALLTSRIIFFIFHRDAYAPSFDLRTLYNLVAIWDQGFSFWGALLGGTFALAYRLHQSEENSKKWSDAMIVPVMIGIMIGEVGAFLGGYSYGEPTSLPWGVRYEVFNVKYTVPVHPTQLYTILGLGLILYSKKWLSKKTTFFKHEGNTTIYFACTSSLLFFLLEFLKGDDTLSFYFVRITQVLFLILFVWSGEILYKRLKQQNYGPIETPHA